MMSKFENNVHFKSTARGMHEAHENILKFVISPEWHAKRKRFKMEKIQPPASGATWPVTTAEPVDKCSTIGERLCEDGTCISRIDLCPEEQLMNQNTILIMIIVGMSVVTFLVILYCFQQRQRRALPGHAGTSVTAGLTDEYDNASLYAPPPTYEDVVNTNLYPPTPQGRRLRHLSSEEPMTPPPNYDTALQLLAQSQESVFAKFKRQSSSVIRRSVSLELCNGSSNGHTSPLEKDSPPHERIGSKFRYSGAPRRQSSIQSSPLSSPKQSVPSTPQYSPPPFDTSTTAGLGPYPPAQMDSEAVT